MAEIININPGRLIHAATHVAEHLASAAIPPVGALPPAAVPSPADVAASRVENILHAKMTCATTALVGKGPGLTGATTGAAAGLRVQDADNASRVAAVQVDRL